MCAAAACYFRHARRAMFRAAIRNDVCANLDSGALALIRCRWVRPEVELVRRLATLTEVRLLDLST
ncbi:hypothetical protein NXT08_24710 (plasmid) [Rhodococcus pyridinivorans]|uniref:hypothetical protein n=1 Tax=Rhodococcus pyridinivorans TaxID=103816 RepID=UPI0021649515|nr:hypothetical protein [Rhodococcus pyridinivorans]UVT27703.1 hypothetical protein NXT08_24710 [Rhodococcus pyridinivorans]